GDDCRGRRRDHHALLGPPPRLWPAGELTSRASAPVLPRRFCLLRVDPPRFALGFRDGSARRRHGCQRDRCEEAAASVETKKRRGGTIRIVPPRRYSLAGPWWRGPSSSGREPQLRSAAWGSMSPPSSASSAVRESASSKVRAMTVRRLA